MQIAVVYESLFGNTRTIAEAVAEGLGHEEDEVTVATVDGLSPEDAAEAALIVVGGPTHNRGIAKADARAAVTRRGQATRHGAVLPGRESLRDWLDRLPAGHAAVATFDTRFDKPAWIVGSAAKAVAQRLDAKGYEVTGSQSFFVRGTGGPLAEGERERAVAWGTGLAAAMRTSQPVPA